jgi:hypothetical protein
VRFEIFKRDLFACQYCGRKAPEVILHVDHITPKSAGGDDDILNLVTSCADCNLGKSDKLLSQHQEIERRRESMEALEQRRQQLAMMRDWHLSLASLDIQAADMLWGVWCSITGLSDECSDEFRAALVQLLKKYSFDEVASAMNLAAQKHLAPSTVTHANGGGVAFAHVAKYCRIARINAEDPVDGRRRYIIGILRNRLSYINTASAASLITDAISCGVDIDYVESAAKQSSSWTQFRNTICDACDLCSEQSTQEEESDCVQ